MNTPVAILSASIGPVLASIRDHSDEQLWTKSSGWFAQENQEDGRYSGEWRDRFAAFISERVEPALRQLGDEGAKLWDYLCDPESAMNKDRVAALVLALSVTLGLQALDISTAVAIVVLAIKLKARGP